MAVYAVSDLHGQYETFMAGLDKIGFGNTDYLFIVGDAIDRGKDGIKLLRYIKEKDNMELLIGNHEFMMLNSVNPYGNKRCDGVDTNLWLHHNGGLKTFEEYTYLTLKNRTSLLFWLQDCYVIKSFKVGGRSFCLTHSYYDEKLENLTYDEIEYQDVWNIVWKSVFRDDVETHGEDIYANYNYTFITGHVPVFNVMNKYDKKGDCNELRVYEKGNLIDIDGGCAAGYREGLNNGALFIRLDDMKVFPVPLVRANEDD